MKILKIVLLVIVVAIAGVLALAATKPNTRDMFGDGVRYLTPPSRATTLSRAEAARVSCWLADSQCLLNLPRFRGHLE